MLTKAQLIDGILQLNPTATPTWLEGFPDRALNRYLAHLQHGTEPRGSRSFWLREPETGVVVTRKPAA